MKANVHNLEDWPRHANNLARHRLAGLFLLAPLAAPPCAALLAGSQQVNSLIYWCWLPFIFMMLPEFLAACKKMSSEPWARIPALLTGSCVIVWEFSYGPGYLKIVPPTYLLLPAFLIAGAAWFSHTQACGLRFIFSMKLAISAIVFLFICITIINRSEFGSENFTFLRMPFYRHVRHLNYDLTIAAALVFILWPSLQYSLRIFAGLALVIIGSLTVWSGGRGGFLAIVFFVLLFSYSSKINFYHFVIIPIIALIAGMLAAYFLHNGGYIYSPGLERSKVFNIYENANVISSGRMEIWHSTLSLFSNDWISIVFGHGPESFKTFKAMRLNPEFGGLVQPHNFVAQWLLDFGILGSSSLFLGLGILVKRCLLSIHMEESAGPHAAASALFVSLIAYSLLDGLLYHAAPLTFILLLAAYLLASPPVSQPKPYADQDTERCAT